ncbi:MAG: asparagine synthetase B, partial [candidate division Zixibacteria bacterium]|nr:asparagine synthetase B [candidate division Zixibacteria bacterium]
MKNILLTLLLLSLGTARADKLLIPMDGEQKDHLKAYGVAYWTLAQGQNVEWLLNYRGGSFMTEPNQEVQDRLNLEGVTYAVIPFAQAGQIYQEIEENNMEVAVLEKAPKIGVYVPPTNDPWDDAVRLALEYADIPYETAWDEEVLKGEIYKFDWLHLHHEDFTGQYGKFYSAFRNAAWYLEEVESNQALAKKLGFAKVSDMKANVSRILKNYVGQGGFLFAVCSAPETFDIALAAENVDIVPVELDGDPFDPDCQSKLNYSRTLAFTNFTLSINAAEYRHSTIDTTPEKLLSGLGAGRDYFTLFEFSAKLDPVPTMLVQNHAQVIKGFMGQTTGFKKEQIKNFVTILGETNGLDEVKYLHGNFGRGTFTFLGGHDPEDYEHAVGDPPTDLVLH